MNIWTLEFFIPESIPLTLTQSLKQKIEKTMNRKHENMKYRNQNLEEMEDPECQILLNPQENR